MKKAWLITAFVLMLATLAACSRFPYGRIITDSMGKSIAVVTDKNGEAATDEAGNLYVVVTDSDGSAVTKEDGKAETNRQSPPVYYVVGKNLYGARFDLTIPRGWELTSKTQVILKDKKTQAELMLLPKIGALPGETIGSANEIMAQAEAADPQAVLDITKTPLCGTTADEYKLLSPKSGAYLIVYVFEKNNVQYWFQVVVKQEYFDQLDYKTIMNSIVFK